MRTSLVSDSHFREVYFNSPQHFLLRTLLLVPACSQYILIWRLRYTELYHESAPRTFPMDLHFLCAMSTNHSARQIHTTVVQNSTGKLLEIILTSVQGSMLIDAVLPDIHRIILEWCVDAILDHAPILFFCGTLFQTSFWTPAKSPSKEFCSS